MRGRGARPPRRERLAGGREESLKIRGTVAGALEHEAGGLKLSRPALRDEDPAPREYTRTLSPSSAMGGLRGTVAGELKK